MHRYRSVVDSANQSEGDEGLNTGKGLTCAVKQASKNRTIILMILYNGGFHEEEGFKKYLYSVHSSGLSLCSVLSFRGFPGTKEATATNVCSCHSTSGRKTREGIDGCVRRDLMSIRCLTLL